MQTVSVAIGVKNPARRIIAIPPRAGTQARESSLPSARFLLASGYRPTGVGSVETLGAELTSRSELVLVEFDGERKDLHFVASLKSEHLAEVSYIAQGPEPVVYSAGQHHVDKRPWLTATRLPYLLETHDSFRQAITNSAALASTASADDLGNPAPSSVQAMDLSESGQTIAIGIPHQFQIVNGETLKTQWNCNLERSPRTIYSEHKRLADLHWTCACFVDPQKPALVLGAHANGPIFLFDTRQTQVARTLELRSREASRANALSGFAKAYEILLDCPSGPVRLCAPTKTATHPLTSTVLALTRVPQRHSTVLASTDDGMMLSLDLLRDQASMLLKQAPNDRTAGGVFASALALQPREASLRVAIAAYGIHQEPTVSIWSRNDRGGETGMPLGHDPVSSATAALTATTATAPATSIGLEESLTFEQRFRDHDELIIALAWHPSAVWIKSPAGATNQPLLASLSADGRLVVRTAPVIVPGG